MDFLISFRNWIAQNRLFVDFYLCNKCCVAAGILPEADVIVSSVISFNAVDFVTADGHFVSIMDGH